MVKEGIVLGHKNFVVELEVNQEKISVITTLVPLIVVKGIISFRGQAGFYRKFIQYFSKIARPLCKMLEKHTKFDFDEACRKLPLRRQGQDL